MREAFALHRAGRLPEAIALLDKLLSQRPGDAIAWNNRANMLLEIGRLNEALQSYDRAIALNPEYAEAWHNRAVARMLAADRRGAESDLDRALLLRPDYAEAWYKRGVVLSQLGQLNEALVSYDRALAAAPGLLEALTSRGTLLNQLQRYAQAVADFDRTIAIRADDAVAWQGRGSALARLNHEEEAIASFNEALQLRPADPLSLYNRASLYSSLKRYDEAVRDLDTLLSIDRDFPRARGLLMHVHLHVCDWRDLTEARREIGEAVRTGLNVIHPFGYLAISDSEADQLQCAKTLVREFYAAPPAPLWPSAPYNHEKIRVAYLSGDFHEHAIPFLIAGVFEHHDRQRFETFGISYGPDDKSEMRARLKKAFTRFVDVRDAGDADIAAMLGELEIDIAIDLKGYTGGARPGILTHRPAPIQVTYLGYPGTLGADYIDYLIADRTVIPEEHRALYSEQIVYLPDTYQCNDSQRRIAARTVSRAEENLPEKAFVFCCFNGNHKIMPEIFGVWMDLLLSVDDSVLWLLHEHPSAAANLRREAEARGVSAERLIFAKRMPLQDHLARLKLADLVLDTLPYGAHTTASDALWAGVPVLTRMGKTFAGRVAASLLTAIGLPELITHSPAQYEARARELAQNAPLLGGIRAKLAKNRMTMPLFDTALITRNLEAAYIEMWDRHRRGERPASF